MKKSIIIKEFLLVITTIIWGLGFIAQSIGGSYLDIFTFNFLRNLVATIFLFLLVIVNRTIKKKKGIFIKDSNIKELWIGGILIGTSLAFAMSFQQFGINNEGAGKSGFLTALYIVFVPFFGIFLKKKINFTSFIAILFSLIGLYLINTSETGFSFSIGTIFLILCAISYSIQIMLIDKYSKNHDSFELSCIEFLVATVLILPFSLIFGNGESDLVISALPQILFLGIGSSGIAYTIQMYAQKEVNVTVSCIIMSLESVFSLIFGVLFLKEAHTILQYIGCVSIFVAVILSQIKIDVFKKNR